MTTKVEGRGRRRGRGGETKGGVGGRDDKLGRDNSRGG